MELIKDFPVHSAGIVAMRFHQDLLFTAGEDGSLFILKVTPSDDAKGILTSSFLGIKVIGICIESISFIDKYLILITFSCKSLAYIR